MSHPYGRVTRTFFPYHQTAPECRLPLPEENNNCVRGFKNPDFGRYASSAVEIIPQQSAQYSQLPRREAL